MDRSAQGHLDKSFYQKFKLYLDYRESGKPVLYVSDNSDLSVLDYLRFKTKESLRPIRVSNSQLLEMINDGDSENKAAEFRHNNPASSESDLEYASDNKIVKGINAILSQAIKSQASDIHFEPGEKYLRVRNRLDGVLNDVKQLNLSEHPEILSRIKIMSKLDIAEKRRPQDGRIRFGIDDRLVDIRVSIIPTDFGEKAVLRILDKEQLKLDLNSLGFADDQLRLFRNNIASTSGIILVTGPTGSGKTTTLYAALNHLKSSSINISTVEDPIEYNLDGINQTQVKPDINLTFAAMLRALLRQDPNIIMVGEIRDRETLEIAIRAAQTGHLVLSTVHTNSGVSTVTRLLDLGTEPFLLASSLRMIVAQRLVRKICGNCSTGEVTKEENSAALQLGIGDAFILNNGSGCEECNHSGYKGRTAMYEILNIDDDLREIIHSRGSEKDVLDCARLKGYRTMKERAVNLISERITTATEIIRELGA